jgi:hypothetical protein
MVTDEKAYIIDAFIYTCHRKSSEKEDYQHIKISQDKVVGKTR